MSQTPLIIMPSLTELSPGVVTHDVPVEDGAVQINIPRYPETVYGQLIVSVEEGAIVLERDKDLPLQVDINYEVGRFDARRRRRLFARPIADLSLTMINRQQGLWQAKAEGLSVLSEQTLRQFLTFVFRYTYQKQMPQAKLAEILDILDRDAEA